ncbi:anti-sigma factor [Leeuwenhoekiella sp. W20_SRS_FM14]|uniref:anti-sigma factor n=1 Tax=Leeuwenhoekiella sp. W20_SRS_FM14 TaxID=3240270 RepID=UPI003F9DFC00
MKKIKFLGLLTAAALLASCSGDDDSVQRSDITITSLTGLERLGTNAEYQAWITVDGQDISLGRFTDVNVPKSFSAPTSQITSATKFKISVEKSTGDSPEISNSIILSGTFGGNSASLNSKEGIGDFVGSSGVFTLQTPTDSNANNEQSGVYFFNATNGTAGLNLPTLPAGWKYEGWVTVPNASGEMKNLSTGKFTKTNTSDETSRFGGPLADPNFPGEDFLDTGLLALAYNINVEPNLISKRVFISIEPADDNDLNTPFFLQPLSGTANNGVSPNINTMGLNTGSLPEGRVVY